MRITAIDLQCEDIMWFGIDKYDRIISSCRACIYLIFKIWNKRVFKSLFAQSLYHAIEEMKEKR